MKSSLRYARTQKSLFEFIGSYARRVSSRTYIALGCGLLVVTMAYGFVFAAPIEFPTSKIIVIERGSTLKEISTSLKQDHVIRSPFVFRLFISLLAGESSLRAGAYQFNQTASLIGVIQGLLGTEHVIIPVRITFPEGVTVKEMGTILQNAIPGFDSETFIALATPEEGFLFPDTYLIAPGSTPKDVVDLLSETFDERVQELAPELQRSGHSLRDAVIMASLLEKEARSTEVRRMIAGILWNRLTIDMPLQVDAVFGYIAGTKTFHPSYDDLEVESLYNTYKYKGLPPGPIGNPGLEALRAAITPVKTDYLFYLTDAAGGIHYSKDFAGHIRNRERYQ